MSDDWGFTKDYQGGGDAPSGFDDWDSGDVDQSKIGSGRREVDKVGKYHFEISEVTARPLPYATDDMSKHRRPDIGLTCTVLQTAPNQSPAGAIYYHSLVMGGKGPGAPIEQWAKEATMNFLAGVGILQNRNGVWIDPETGTTRINSKTLVPRLKAVRQFVGNIRLNKSDDPKYPDKFELMFGRGAYPVDAPEVADVPKNEEARKLLSEPAPAPASNASADDDDI